MAQRKTGQGSSGACIALAFVCFQAHQVVKGRVKTKLMSALKLLEETLRKNKLINTSNKKHKWDVLCSFENNEGGKKNNLNTQDEERLPS